MYVSQGSLYGAAILSLWSFDLDGLESDVGRAEIRVAARKIDKYHIDL